MENRPLGGWDSRETIVDGCVPGDGDLLDGLDAGSFGVEPGQIGVQEGWYAGRRRAPRWRRVKRGLV